ncbi:MAG TPA: class I SAM-dependent methyltransferase [Actinomycetota bacterium]|nr:class I SAM-dependent methyltransferase [Actinomycetota bacterium]
MDIVNPAVERYLRDLAASDDELVLVEMEKLAEDEGFPIIGRLCGRYLEMLARSISARRIFEMGSGYGYSAYWFSRATGPEGEIHLTDTDPGNERRALDFLHRAGLDAPIRYHVGDAFAALDEAQGDFDVVYVDIDKHGYLDAWNAGKERVRVGGYYVCDNMLWSGRVTGEVEKEDTRPHWTEAIVATNRAIADDPRFRETINPTRDGVVAALRIA